jgi:hypothetical protein
VTLFWSILEPVIRVTDVQIRKTYTIGQQAFPLGDSLILDFRFRLGGRDHTSNDPQCPGCQSSPGERWPKAHRSYPGATCLGLVHAEKFVKPGDQKSEIVFWCDVCQANPK